MDGVRYGSESAESIKKAEQKKHFYNRFFQKKRYKDAYRAARAGKSAGSVVGITTYPSSDQDIYAAENAYTALEQQPLPVLRT